MATLGILLGSISPSGKRVVNSLALLMVDWKRSHVRGQVVRHTLSRLWNEREECETLNHSFVM